MISFNVSNVTDSHNQLFIYLPCDSGIDIWNDFEIAVNRNKSHVGVLPKFYIIVMKQPFTNVVIYICMPLHLCEAVDRTHLFHQS